MGISKYSWMTLMVSIVNWAILIILVFCSVLKVGNTDSIVDCFSMNFRVI